MLPIATCDVARPRVRSEQPRELGAYHAYQRLVRRLAWRELEASVHTNAPEQREHMQRKLLVLEHAAVSEHDQPCIVTRHYNNNARHQRCKVSLCTRCRVAWARTVLACQPENYDISHGALSLRSTLSSWLRSSRVRHASTVCTDDGYAAGGSSAYPIWC